MSLPPQGEGGSRGEAVPGVADGGACLIGPADEISYFYLGKNFPCWTTLTAPSSVTLAIGPPIEGGSHADLATVIRAKVAAGLLPKDRPPKMWVGPGAGSGATAAT